MKPLVIFSSQDFDDLPTRKHKLAKHFSSKVPILYIEAPFTYLSALKDPTYKPKVKRSGQIKQIRPNLWVASPPAMMPFYGRIGFMQKMACGKIANFALKIMKEINFPKDFTALIYLPWMKPVIDKIKPRVVFYDCVDDHAGYGGTSSKAFIEKAEELLCKSCDAVFTTAKSLQKRLSSFNTNTVYLPNAVDPEIFKPTSPSSEVEIIPKPRVVYSGALRWWFDSDLMIHLAEELPNIHFIIIGGERNSELGENGRKLRAMHNVHFLGKRFQEELPGLMSGSCCGIIPFKENALIASVSPLKLYEYASMCLPTVSVPMAELVDMPADVVRVANGFEQFKQEILNFTLKSPNADVLKVFSANNTWDTRFALFEDELERCWKKERA